MTNVILVPGAFHGGWYFAPLTEVLISHGHSVWSPTLPGLEPGGAVGCVNLTTHVDFLSKFVEGSGRRATLVAHSYGGAVAMGVAAMSPDLVEAMIFLDATVPRPGQRVWDLLDSATCAAFLASTEDGLTIPVPDQFSQLDNRAAPHPLATLLQPLRYDERSVTMPRTYVLAEAGPFEDVYRGLLEVPGWNFETVPYGHDLVREAPDALTSMLVRMLAAIPFVSDRSLP